MQEYLTTVTDTLNEAESDSAIESSVLLDLYNELLADLQSRIEALNEDLARG